MVVALIGGSHQLSGKFHTALGILLAHCQYCTLHNSGTYTDHCARRYAQCGQQLNKVIQVAKRLGVYLLDQCNTQSGVGTTLVTHFYPLLSYFYLFLVPSTYSLLVHFSLVLKSQD